MARLIDADALFAKINRFDFTEDLFGAGMARGIARAMSAILQAPTIEAEPVRNGRWVDRYGGKYVNPLYECSECKKKALYKIEIDGLGKEQIVQALSDVCPNCGAKMDKEEE